MSRSVTPSSTNQGSNNKKSARTISSKNHLYSGMDGVNESVAQPLMDGAARNKKEAKEADLKSLVASVRMQMTSSTFFGETYWNPRLHPQKTDNVITDKDVVCNNAASTDSCCLGNGCYLDMIKENSRKIFALYVEKARKKARVANNCGQKPVKDLELVKQLFSKLIVKRVRDRGGRFLILQTVGDKHEFAAGRNGDWIEIADIDAINKAKNDLTAAMEQEDDWESHKNVAELTIEPNEEEEEEEEEERDDCHHHGETSGGPNWETSGD
ncbi:expressed unknown protein [Seminavis robusta]|uniref:Uncharacterized protein n=1 Tax=Seminavis robusta TaxID=568900 RepID=A0A9N8HGB7_9STRA|nr:expressed unknown protein [Seminavis robusta]|eukprot:Sro390_g132940.1 n/a (269) ;mRNA; r:55501-56389